MLIVKRGKILKASLHIISTAATRHSRTPKNFEQDNRLLEIFIIKKEKPRGNSKGHLVNTPQILQKESCNDHLVIVHIAAFGHHWTTEDSYSVSKNFYCSSKAQWIEQGSLSTDVGPNHTLRHAISMITRWKENPNCTPLTDIRELFGNK